MTEKKRKGFAAISPERRREISSLGGKRAHELGRAHRFTSEEARTAGKKGGLALHALRGTQKQLKLPLEESGGAETDDAPAPSA